MCDMCPPKPIEEWSDKDIQDHIKHRRMLIGHRQSEIKEFYEEIRHARRVLRNRSVDTIMSGQHN